MLRIKHSLLWRTALLALVISVSLTLSDAQNTPSPVITEDTLKDLGSIAQIDFEGTPVETGWFFMNRSGTRYVTHSPHEIYVWSLDENGDVSEPSIFETKNAVLTSAAFAPDDTLYGVLQGEDTQIISIESALTPVRTLEGWTLMNLWADEDALWGEAFSDEIDAQEVILRIPYDVQEDISILPYAPGEDLEAVVRIGRIAAPYTVTSTETGRVSVWDLTTGERLHEVDTEVGQAAVFGAMNVSATHLIWRDQASEGLYWLDLETETNRQISPLNGEYVQWFFLTPQADVILGIDKEFSQHVTAWTLEGDEIDLGPYRSCERPQPDMTMLSIDGTTLAIGCDTGIDIWRVNP